jgi:carbonic anhydrase
MLQLNPMKRFIAILSALAGIASAQQQQSPIDINSLNTESAILPAVQYSYSPLVNLNLVNNRDVYPDDDGEFATIRADLTSGTSSITVNNVVYNLVQFHFHTLAEHEINGVRGAGELHLVHQAGDGTLLVIGQVFNVGAMSTVLAPYFSNLPLIDGGTQAVNNFNLAGLIPSDLTSFRYLGSLTAASPGFPHPPFMEGVNWIVLSSTAVLSQDQLNAFTNIFHHGNSREVQPLNGRVPLTDVLLFPYDQALTFFSMFK